MMARHIAILLLIFGLAASSCGALEGHAPTRPEEPVCVKADEDFTITLDSNRTTGYGWERATSSGDEKVRFISSEYVPADTGLVGSGGREIWTFRAGSPGKAQLAFIYVRPWEKGAEPARKTVFTVCITDSGKKGDNQKGDRCSGRR